MTGKMPVTKENFKHPEKIMVAPFVNYEGHHYGAYVVKKSESNMIDPWRSGYKQYILNEKHAEEIAALVALHRAINIEICNEIEAIAVSSLKRRNGDNSEFFCRLNEIRQRISDERRMDKAIFL